MTRWAAIEVRVDGRPWPLPRGATLADLAAAAGHAPADVATAVNGSFVARERRGMHVLEDGDEVLFFQPIVGG
jgi:sulfur carrier protein